MTNNESSNTFNSWQIIQSSLGQTRVLIDGVEIRGTQSVKFETSINSTPVIHLTIIPETINFDKDGP